MSLASSYCSWLGSGNLSYDEFTGINCSADSSHTWSWPVHTPCTDFSEPSNIHQIFRLITLLIINCMLPVFLFSVVDSSAIRSNNSHWLPDSPGLNWLPDFQGLN